MTKHEAMQDWLAAKVYELMGKYLYFNVLLETGVSILTDASETESTEEYIDGSADREYLCYICLTTEQSEETDDVNVAAMNLIDELMAWVREQDEAENYPDFGSDCYIDEVKALQNMAMLAGQSTTDNNSRRMQYRFGIRVKYYEEA